MLVMWLVYVMEFDSHGAFGHCVVCVRCQRGLLRFLCGLCSRVALPSARGVCLAAWVFVLCCVGGPRVVCVYMVCSALRLCACSSCCVWGAGIVMVFCVEYVSVCVGDFFVFL